MNDAEPEAGVDISYGWTREGWRYLAVTIDLFSRLVVGWPSATAQGADRSFEPGPPRLLRGHQAEQAIARCIDGFYNPIRRHAACDYISPAQFE